MLTDPQIVLNRLKRYPHLDFVKPKWVRTATAKRSVGVWHPFFEDDEASSNQIMGNLDKVIGYLLEEKVDGTRTRAQHLCVNTKDEFWSSFTELVQGAKLRAGYPIRYLPSNGPRAPDIELTTSSGLVYVEITAMHKTWDFHATPQYISDALNGLQHGYRIGVECRSDTIKLSEEVLNDLAEQVKTHIVAEPYPSNNENKRVFRSSDGQVTVDLRRSDQGEGYTLASTLIGGRSPDAYFGQIMTRLEEKGPQAAGYRPCVVVIELANAAGNVAMLGSQDKMWSIYSPNFRVDEIPTEIDLVILTWQTILGRTWGNARVFRNPKSQWAQSPDAENIYQLIAGEVGVLASAPTTPASNAIAGDHVP